MGWVSDPYEYSLQDLQDLRINESKHQDKGCSGLPSSNREFDTEWAGFKYPKNGEFEYSGYGDGCNYCNWGRGKECSGIDSLVGGNRPGVKRISFKGDKLGCCINNTKNPGGYKLHDGKTCDPVYRNPSSQDCNIELNNFCKDWNRIVENEYCYALKDSNTTLFNKLMKAHCNWSDSNAQQDKCIDWCKTNSTDCERLNLINDCKTYGLSGSNCTKQAVIDIKNKCKVYGILSEQGLQKGSYQCTPAGIEVLETDCKKYNMSSCTVDGIDQVQILKAQEEQSAKALAESQKQFTQTQAALSQVIDLPSQVQPIKQIQELQQPQWQQMQIQELQETQPVQQVQPVQDNATIYIIIFLVILCILVLSSSSFALFAIKKK